jgi:hypothetical protein
MAAKTREDRLQSVARRCGLKLVLDRYSARETGDQRYFLRPIWDARQAVLALPGGGCELVKIYSGRRRAASLMPLDDVERLLGQWSEPKPFAPARLPWQVGVVAALADASSHGGDTGRW